MALLLIVPLLLLLLSARLLFGMALRVAAAVGLAAVGGTTLSLAVGQDAGVALVLSGLLFWPALFLTLRTRRRRKLVPVAAPSAIRPTAPIGLPTRAEDRSWTALIGMADWRTGRRLQAARAMCDRYMAQAEMGEHETAQLPIKIGKHLPAIVADCVRHASAATPDERRALIADTLATVEQLATRAEIRRRELAHEAQTGFRTLRAHLAAPDD